MGCGLAVSTPWLLPLSKRSLGFLKMAEVVPQQAGAQGSVYQKKKRTFQWELDEYPLVLKTMLQLAMTKAETIGLGTI